MNVKVNDATNKKYFRFLIRIAVLNSTITQLCIKSQMANARSGPYIFLGKQTNSHQI